MKYKALATMPKNHEYATLFADYAKPGTWFLFNGNKYQVHHTSREAIRNARSIHTMCGKVLYFRRDDESLVETFPVGRGY